MLAFVHMEKTAGLTVNWIMRRKFGARHCYVEPWTRKDLCFSASDFRRLSRCHPKLKSIGGHPIKPWSDLADACGSVRYYTFLREPLSRCASHYQYQVAKMGQDISFDDWIENEVYRNFQVKKLAGRDDLDAAIRALKEKVAFIGLMERFDESLVLLKRQLGDDDLDISYQRQNTARDNTIKTRVLTDAKMRAKLEAANQLDLELYESARQELYPRQQEAYGESLEADLDDFKNREDPARKTSTELAYLFQRNLIYKPLLYTYRSFHRSG